MSLQVAQTIKDQLYAFDANLMGCLGSHNFRGGGEVEGKHCGFLMFDVQNLQEIQHGTVQIILNGLDLYNIRIYGDDLDLFAVVENVYFDQLTEVIESKIGH